MTEATTHRLTRDGRKDFEFKGVLLASADDHETNGPNNSRWNERELYRTEGGKYVLRRRYITRWQGEEGSEDAEVFETAADLVAEIMDGDSVSNLHKRLIKDAAIDDDAFDGVLVECVE